MDGKVTHKDAAPLPQLAWRIPRAQDHHSSRIEGRLKQSDEEPQRDYLVRSLHSRHAESQRRPDKLTERDPPARADLRQQNLRGDLSDDVSTGPGGIDDVQLLREHSQIFSHAADVCISDVDRVEVFHEEAERQDGDEMDVQFLNEATLFSGTARLPIPDVRPPWWLAERLFGGRRHFFFVKWAGTRDDVVVFLDVTVVCL